MFQFVDEYYNGAKIQNICHSYNYYFCMLINIPEMLPEIEIKEVIKETLL